MKLQRRKIEREANEARLILPEVRRVDTGTGSHIEPPCEDGWTDDRKIAWHAAVVAHDSGLDGLIRVHKQDDGGYCLQVGNTGISSMPFYTLWTYLNGVSMGVQVCREGEQ